MPTFASSYQPASGATVKRNADVLPLPFLARPQAMTVYVRFVELGSILTGTTTRVWHIGSSNNNNPRLAVNNNGSGLYQMVHVNLSAASVAATLAAAPSLDDMVELLGELGADGSVKLSQSVNGTAETTTATSAALVLPAAWSTPTLLYLNSIGTLVVGFLGLRNLVGHRGIQTFATMRRLAGVPT